MSDQSFFQFFKWIYQERYFVGRGLFENLSDYCRYVAFWLVVLASKFTFAYFLQIKPLVKPTNTIIHLPPFQYSWHDIVSKSNDHALTIVSLWAPVLAIYLMDIHIWYTLLSAIIGGVMGAKARLGEIRTIEMVHKRFESFPEAFAQNLVSPVVKRVPLGQHASQDGQDMNKAYAAMFSPFWNEIIKSLREEDYLSNREMDLLSIPSNTGSLRLVQWPLFLLCSKILVAIDLAMECKETQEVLWRQICDDEYMAYAVQECYYSVEKILNSMVNDEGRRWYSISVCLNLNVCLICEDHVC
jgi:callose synthase